MRTIMSVLDAIMSVLGRLYKGIKEVIGKLKSICKPINDAEDGRKEILNSQKFQKWVLNFTANSCVVILLALVAISVISNRLQLHHKIIGVTLCLVALVTSPIVYALSYFGKLCESTKVFLALLEFTILIAADVYLGIVGITSNA